MQYKRTCREINVNQTGKTFITRTTLFQKDLKFLHIVYTKIQKFEIAQYY